MTDHNQPNEKPSAADLDWIAFQYLAGELDEQQLVSFEARLEHDESAQSALVRSVELVELTRTSLRDSAPAVASSTTASILPTVPTAGIERGGRFAFRSSLTWTIIGSGLAVSILTLLVIWYTRPSGPSISVVDQTDVANEKVAHLWAASLDLESLDDDGLFETDPDQLSAAMDAFDTEADIDEDTNWLLEALREVDPDPSSQKNSMQP